MADKEKKRRKSKSRSSIRHNYEPKEEEKEEIRDIVQKQPKAEEKGRKEIEKKYYKEHFEKNKDEKEEEDSLKNGPMDDDKRQCRDVFFLIVFFLFLIACIAVAAMGFYYGNPKIILYPYDENGNQCGQGNLKDYKFLYFYKAAENKKDLEISQMINGICVKICPNWTFPEENINKTNETTVDCFPTKNNTNCSVTYENYYVSEGCK